MSFFANTGFGSQSSSPFGQTQQTSVFGQPQQQQQSAFGTPAFGAQSTPAFGAQSTPAFGTPAFGASTGGGFGFGATPAASNPFGAASTPAFGAASTPAFGVASTATPFGAAPGASSSPFGGGGSVFGQTQSAFGAPAATPAFGSPAGGSVFGQQSAPAFGAVQPSGTTPFGGSAAPGGFGAPGFGQAAVRGTRSVPWQRTQETETTPAGAKANVNHNSITMMPQYMHKSHEELRWEDYQDGVKGGGGAASPAAGGLFGGAAASPGQPAFGAASSAAFGTPAFSGAFGAGSQTPSMFGQQQTGGSLFGGGGAFGAPPQSQPAFGSTSFGAATSTPAFGAATTSTPAFGGFGTPASQPQSAFGGFGTPASQPQSAFGAAPASQPSVFGGFGAPTSAPAFGASPSTGSSLFGATSMPAFGGFGATSTQASAPAFGATPSSAPAFGGGGGLFGAASSASAFGAAASPATPGLFGGATSAPAGGFSFSLGGAPSTPASASSLFGASTPATGASSLFGAPPASAAALAFGGAFSFGGTAQSTAAPSLFGGSTFGGASSAPATASAPAFSFGGAPGGGTSFLGTAAAPQPAPALGAVSPSSPYGALPALPSALPAAAPGIGLSHQRRTAPWSGSGTPPARIPALAIPRTISPRPGSRLRPARAVSLLSGRGRDSAPFDGSTPTTTSGIFAVAAATPVNGERSSTTPGSTATGVRKENSAASPGIFTPRDDPRRLFIRDALPSTSAGSIVTPSRLGAPIGQSPLAALPTTPGAFASANAPRLQEARTRTPTSGAANGIIATTAVVNGDAAIEQLLPTLHRAEYYTVPSLVELAALAREDPAALSSVPEFVVGRRSLGSVRWLEPVDVRGLDLDAIVSISRGSVEVYLDGPEKPPVGRGLNRPAEVTMLKIHKLDKATGVPTTETAPIEAFTRKLRRVSAEQGARFISYDAKSGTWRFQVDHFSRYGLFDDDDEEQEEDAGTDLDEGTTTTKRSLASRGRRLGISAESDSEGSSMMDEGGCLQPMEDDDDDGLGEEERYDPERRTLAFGGGELEEQDSGPRAEPFFSRAPILASLASSAGVGASELSEELARVREGLFGRPILSSKRNASPADAARAHASPRYAPPEAKAWKSEDGHKRKIGIVVGPAGEQRSRRNLDWRSPKETNWVKKRPPALLPPSSKKKEESLRIVAAARDKMSRPSGTAVHPREKDAPLDISDYPRVLGRTSRIRWAAGLTFAASEGTYLDTSTVRIRELRYDGGSSKMKAHVSAPDHHRVFQTTPPEDTLSLLQVHLEHSQIVSSSYEDNYDDKIVCPRWRLVCGRESALAPLTERYVITLGEQAARATDEISQQSLALQAAAWDLVRILFEGLDGERAFLCSSSASSHKKKRDDDGMALDDDDDAYLSDSSMDHQQLLVDFRRRAELSAWLRDRVCASTTRALESLKDTNGLVLDDHNTTTNHNRSLPAAWAPSAVLTLLTGRQITAAAAVASAAGDVRLATLISQAGASGAGDAASQEAAWKSAGVDRYIDGARRLILALISGDVERVTPLVFSDWRRAVGLFLWYGVGPDAPLASVLEAYRGAVEKGTAAPPVPFYVERARSVDGQDLDDDHNVTSTRVASTDGGWELLQLGATWREGLCVPVRGQSIAPLLRRLSRPGAWTVDALDGTPGWHLLTVLAGAGVVSDDEQDGSSCAIAIERAADSLIARLEAIHRPAWAIYVALCIPREIVREATTRSLLTKHAASWEDTATRRFLTDTLHVPARWVAASLATLCRSQRKPKECLVHLLEAGDWQSAHDLLCGELAGPWFLDNKEETSAELVKVLRILENHVGSLIGYAEGANIYAMHLALRRTFHAILSSTHRRMEQSTDDDGDASHVQPVLDTFADRFAACEGHSRALGLAQARWGSRGVEADPKTSKKERANAVRRQEAFAAMATELAGWVLSDSAEGWEEEPPSVQQTLLAATVPAQSQLHTAWNVRLAASALAQELERDYGEP